MCPEYQIRPHDLSIAQHATQAAQRQVETGERSYNPHVLGTPAHRRWEVSFTRALALHTADEGCEGSA